MCASYAIVLLKWNIETELWATTFTNGSSLKNFLRWVHGKIGHDPLTFEQTLL